MKCDAFAYGNSPRRADGLCLSRNPFNPDELVGGEDRSGIFVSRDNGETWAWEGGGLDAAAGFDYGINHSQGAWPPLAVSPDGSAVTAARNGESMLLSRGPDDAEWTRTGLPEPDWRKYPLAADPFTPGRFLCGGGNRTVQESTDGGRTWHDSAPLRGLRCGGIAFDRHAPGNVVFACRDGLYASDDGGATLRPIEGGLRVPSGRSRFIALDRGRLFFLTSGSGVWGMLLR